MGERRDHKNRIQTGTELKLHLGDDCIAVHVLNISFGGVLLGSDERPEIGTQVRLTGEDITAVSGNVVRHDAKGFAVDLGDSVEAAQFAVESITSDMTPTDGAMGPEDEAS